MQGVILKVLYFKYEDAYWKTQRYAFVQDVIVLKTAPTGTPELDIHYLRDVENLVNDTDEVDLPDELLLDYKELLKYKVKVEFGDLPNAEYLSWLKILANRSRGVVQHMRINNGEIMRNWYPDSLGDREYDITDQRVSQDSVTADVDGDYIFIS